MITVNSKVLEQRYTTAEWLAGVDGKFGPDPVLPDRIAGYDSTALSYKIGNGASKWSELPYWSQYIPGTPFKYTIPAGSDNPTPLSFFGDVDLADGFTFTAEIVINSTTNRTVNDFYVDKIFTNSSKTTINSVLIYGHDDGAGKTAEAAVVTFYP